MNSWIAALMLLLIAMAVRPVQHRQQRARMVLGAQLEVPLEGRDKWLIPNRVYHFPLRWDEVEKVPGVYEYPAYAQDNVDRLNAKLGTNYQLIIGVKCTPPFYSIEPHARNSPPSAENYLAFARFVEDVYRTYLPWGIEIWNEPESTLEESERNACNYGGFGRDGAAYGKMTRVVYDHMKLMPVKIIAGASFGLLNPPRAISFLRQAVDAGMVSHYWSWHGYVWYYEIMDNDDRLKDLLLFSRQARTIYNVPQILSEASVMRMTDLPELPAHRAKQAEMLQWLLARQPKTNIESILWYTLADNSWRHTDMCSGEVAHPVYEVWSKHE